MMMTWLEWMSVMLEINMVVKFNWARLRFINITWNRIFSLGWTRWWWERWFWEYWILNIENWILNIEYWVWDEHDGGGRDGFESGDGWIASGGLSRWFQDLGNTVSPPVLHHQTKCDQCNVEFTNNKVGVQSKVVPRSLFYFFQNSLTPWGLDPGGTFKNEKSSN